MSLNNENEVCEKPVNVFDKCCLTRCQVLQEQCIVEKNLLKKIKNYTCQLTNVITNNSPATAANGYEIYFLEQILGGLITNYTTLLQFEVSNASEVCCNYSLQNNQFNKTNINCDSNKCCLSYCELLAPQKKIEKKLLYLISQYTSIVRANATTNCACEEPIILTINYFMVINIITIYKIFQNSIVQNASTICCGTLFKKLNISPNDNYSKNLNNVDNIKKICCNKNNNPNEEALGCCLSFCEVFFQQKKNEKKLLCEIQKYTNILITYGGTYDYNNTNNNVAFLTNYFITLILLAAYLELLYNEAMNTTNVCCGINGTATPLFIPSFDCGPDCGS